MPVLGRIETRRRLLAAGCPEACLGAPFNFQGVDFTGWKLNLAFLDLQDADLRGADLRGLNLSGAALQGASLQNARLEGAVLSGSLLSGADLSGASMKDAVFSTEEIAFCKGVHRVCGCPGMLADVIAYRNAIGQPYNFQD